MRVCIFSLALLVLCHPLRRGKHTEVGKLFGVPEFMGSQGEYMTARVLRPLDDGFTTNRFVPSGFSAGEIIMVGPMKEKVVLVRFIIQGDRRAITPKFRRFVLVGSCSREVSLDTLALQTRRH
jgi:hypothetical protein